MGPILLLILHAAVTIGMTGIIWFVHLVHYPIMLAARTSDTAAFEKLHWRKTMPLAIAMLTVELGTGIALFVWKPPGLLLYQLELGLALLGLIWLTTWTVCVPGHCELKQSGSKAAATVLMRANLFRSILWTLRSLLVFWMLLSVVRA